jgi:hypothetical protein
MSVFVWVRGLHGPEPQLWSNEYDHSGMHRWRDIRVLRKHQLEPADDKLTLDQLALKYPISIKVKPS